MTENSETRTPSGARLPGSAPGIFWQERFGSLPLRCGVDANPGRNEAGQWQDWSCRETTPDQQRIEEYLDWVDLTGLSILHVGIGNSLFALRLACRAETIVGFTISPSEQRHGASLGLPNYRPLLRNKYAAWGGQEHFDIIVDNNPSTFACCRDHLFSMMAGYASSTDPNGIILTDRVGLGWVVTGGNPRWRFDFDDWAAVGAMFGLDATRVNDYLYALARPGVQVPRPKTVPEFDRWQS